ncbi:MAG: DUF6325 family protein [Thermoleophilia bacterium]|jgi:hypothetical protein|nr:DUF6325 family protein [Thermoleophilia bacterium]
MGTDALEDIGPVDIVVIGYPPGAPLKGEAAAIIVDLVDRGIIRVLDALVITKDPDGTFSGIDVSNMSAEQAGDFAVFEGATSGLIGDADLAVAADAMEPGSVAAIIVYENRWAAPFAAAVRRAGGEMLAYERVPVADLVAALDALDAS